MRFSINNDHMHACAGAWDTKKEQLLVALACCGGWDRTTGLQVMSLTSYHCSTPRHHISVLRKSTAKVRLFSQICKFF